MALLACLAGLLHGQVYSPEVLKKGQPDASDLRRLALGIYNRAAAETSRARAEAIWRFFLTDGRFVNPGFWYHIAGWAYEEPVGEVLDPIKLLNSYGFGLCYQIAPVLEAVWKAGGFEDARVWFLTGHTVAEVFYDGAYHYFDSDMMGYDTLPDGRVASVRQIERDGHIITAKLKSPREVNAAAASEPWYPADVREGAIENLAALFTSSRDNSLFPFERAPAGHRMSFVLRPGEKLIRYFAPELDGLYYLPYRRSAAGWEEFPREIPEYNIHTQDGPRSRKDARMWATGRLEYQPGLTPDLAQVVEVVSPYVIIDAQFTSNVDLPAAGDSMTLATSVDGGRSWTEAGALRGPHRGAWRAEPAVLVQSAHGRLTSVSGRYQYLLRVKRSPASNLNQLTVITRFQFNPRTLPQLTPGRNDLQYASAEPPLERREIPLDAATARDTAVSVSHARWISSGEQGFWAPEGDGPAEFVFRLAARRLSAIEAGGRFLDLSRGLAPDKLTAEVRKVSPIPARRPDASIAWARSPSGPFRTLWKYNRALIWRDGEPIDRTLMWPEVDRRLEVGGSDPVYVRYRVHDLAIDQFRLATESRGTGESAVELTHRWTESGVEKKRAVTIPAGHSPFQYAIDIPPGADVVNRALVMECRRGQ